MLKLFDTVPLAAPVDLGFVNGALDRAALRRDDAAWQSAAYRAADTRVIAICQDVPVMGWNGTAITPHFTVPQALELGAVDDAVFLGLHSGRSYFAHHVAPEAFEALQARADLKLIGMRSIAMQGLIDPSMLSAFGTAKSLLSWHARHRFCSACGQPSVATSAGWKRVCPACGTEHFPRTDPVVIMLAVRGDVCLMGRGPQFPEGFYSCLAGFLEPGETIEEAVRRETFEEAGIRVGRVKYIQAQPWPFPSSLMIGCIAEALTQDIQIDRQELADARWFTKQEVASILQNTHAEGFSAPPRMAIAHHMMELFVQS
jgi:NAD+ diphosphatase